MFDVRRGGHIRNLSLYDLARPGGRGGCGSRLLQQGGVAGAQQHAGP
jgi:hypothetical protein